MAKKTVVILQAKATYTKEAGEALYRKVSEKLTAEGWRVQYTKFTDEWDSDTAICQIAGIKSPGIAAFADLLRIVSKCDAVIFDKRWWHMEISRILHALAERANIPILDEYGLELLTKHPDEYEEKDNA